MTEIRIFNKLFMCSFQLMVVIPNLDLLLSFSIALALALVLTMAIIITNSYWLVKAVCRTIQFLVLILYKLL